VERSYDLVVVGGGIVGCAVAMVLAERHRLSLAVLEAEGYLAAHQSGRNSGVIHSGLYYAPGSLKARTCIAGREALFRFCAEAGIPHRRCGKLVVATGEAEIPRLAELARRGEAHGLRGLARLKPAEMREIEPEVGGVEGLWVSETGVVDFREVTRAYARRVEAARGEVLTGARVLAVRRRAPGLSLKTTAGRIECSLLVNCAGLGSDRLARRCGADPDFTIVPFRGDYCELKPARRSLVRGLIYPVPDPELPFLGVHLTRAVEDRVEVGPNAALALARERYGRLAIEPRDAFETLTFPGTWRLLRRYGGTALAEVRCSLSRRAFAAAAARLVPAIRAADLVRSGAGVRAQGVDRQGRLVEDFRLVEGERSLHVLNAPSPAATASLAIGEEVAARVARRFGLG
jgi:L-2-hydroxyglutarate oxidase